MIDILVTLWQLVLVLVQLLIQLLALGLHYSLLIAWLAWWLGAVNWTKLWPVLAQGAWAPVVLIMIVSAFVWSQIAPSACDCLAVVRVPNFWWQLGGVGLLGASALFCGWLQGMFGWQPPELNLEPPAPGHDHHHGHAHH